ncbi:MAG: FtsQ-type POTRA domain-containing protein [Clostridiales bacterium]|nr:FtsQ-type POTRA domain-containing protein [Clostridiales bacterium]
MRNKRLLIIFGILLSLTLLIAIGSAVFSIKMLNAYCYNSDDEVLMSKVQQFEKDLIGKSIFSLDEQALIEEVEKEIGGIKVVNIERLFPNRVSINYVKLYDYFEVCYDGNYYISGIDGRILKKQEQSRDSEVIKIKLNLTEVPEVGGYFSSADRFEALQDMIQMLEKLNYRETNAPALIESIDLVSSESAIYVQTRSGVLIKILQDDNAGEKLRKALSLYTARPEYRTSGMIIVVNSNEIFYSQQSDNTNEESIL